MTDKLEGTERKRRGIDTNKQRRKTKCGASKKAFFFQTNNWLPPVTCLLRMSPSLPCLSRSRSLCSRLSWSRYQSTPSVSHVPRSSRLFLAFSLSLTRFTAHTHSSFPSLFSLSPSQARTRSFMSETDTYCTFRSNSRYCLPSLTFPGLILFYSACSQGATRDCSVSNGCAGTQTCSSGTWGQCAQNVPGCGKTCALRLFQLDCLSFPF